MPDPKRGPGGASHLRGSGAPPNTPTESTSNLLVTFTVCDRQYDKALSTRLLSYSRDGTYSEHLALPTYFTGMPTYFTHVYLNRGM